MSTILPRGRISTVSHVIAASVLFLTAGTSNRALSEDLESNLPETRSHPVLDYAVLPSIQYAHTDIWRHTPTGEQPTLAGVKDDEIAPGQRLDFLIIVRRYGTTPESQANITCDFSFRQPDGKTQPATKRVVVAGRTKTIPSTLLFPQEIVSFTAGPNDPAGAYHFDFAVHDLVTGASLTKSVTVQIGASNNSLPWPGKEDPTGFLANYYLNPRPRLALSALCALGRTPFARRKADGQGALLGFYARILTDNPWLLPQFHARLATTGDDDERRLLALVLAYANQNGAGFRESLPPVAQKALTDAQNENLPRVSAEPMTGGQLDALWGQFFASGRFEAVASLVGIAERYLPYRGKLNAFKQLASKPKIVPPEAYKDAVLGSALWSLRSNASRYKLVHDYLLGIQQSEATGPEIKRVLEDMLQEKNGKSATGAG